VHYIALRNDKNIVKEHYVSNHSRKIQEYFTLSFQRSERIDINISDIRTEQESLKTFLDQTIIQEINN
jgi:hypothetical protein